MINYVWVIVMNKTLKIIIITLVVIVLVILLDTIQALVFNSSPILKIKQHYNGGTLYCKDIGILVDTYNCVNGKKHTVAKGASYSCSFSDDYVIVDTTKEIKDFSCAEALEEIYEDRNYEYFLPCMKSQYIKVRYYDGNELSLVEALNMGYIEIGDLDKFEIDYIKYEKHNVI